MQPRRGIPTIRKTFNQFTCLYQFFLVRGVSVMCVLEGLYDLFLLGSEVFAMGDGCEERKAGSTARWPAAGWLDGMVSSVVRPLQEEKEKKLVMVGGEGAKEKRKE